MLEGAWSGGSPQGFDGVDGVDGDSDGTNYTVTRHRSHRSPWTAPAGRFPRYNDIRQLRETGTK
jgi:hypothetical protein